MKGILLEKLVFLRNKGFLMLDLFSKSAKIPENPKNICLIKSERLGDAVLSLPTIKQIKKAFPSAKVTLITNAYTKKLFENEVYIDEIIDLNHSFLGNFRLLRKLRKQKFDIGVDLTYAKYLKQAFLLYLIKPSYRIGFDTGFRRFFFNLKILPKKGFVYELNRISELIPSFNENNESPPLRLQFNVLKTELIDQLFSLFNLKKNDLKIVIQPGVFNDDPGRLWSPKKYAQLADFLIKQFRAKIIFSGTKNHAPLINNIQSLMQNDSLNFVAKTNLLELADLLKRSNLLISSLTGVTHLAVALNKPTITICGSTPIERWVDKKNSNYIIIKKNLACGPCEMPNFKCDETKFKCIKDISVDDIINQLKKVLKVEKQN